MTKKDPVVIPVSKSGREADGGGVCAKKVLYCGDVCVCLCECVERGGDLIIMKPIGYQVHHQLGSSLCVNEIPPPSTTFLINWQTGGEELSCRPRQRVLFSSRRGSCGEGKRLEVPVYWCTKNPFPSIILLSKNLNWFLIMAFLDNLKSNWMTPNSNQAH